jgi:hypothetical protein
MQKLRLNLDEIRVDRFETVAGEGTEGTVMGQDMLAAKTLNVGTCFVDSCVTGTVRPCPACP